MSLTQMTIYLYAHKSFWKFPGPVTYYTTVMQEAPAPALIFEIHTTGTDYAMQISWARIT